MHSMKYTTQKFNLNEYGKLLNSCKMRRNFGVTIALYLL